MTIFSIAARILILIVLAVLFQGELIAQSALPKELQSELDLVERFEFRESNKYQDTFTDEGELFLTWYDPKTNEWSYYFKASTRPFRPCNGQRYRHGRVVAGSSKLIITCPKRGVEAWDLDDGRLLSRIELKESDYSSKEEIIFQNTNPAGTMVAFGLSGGFGVAELWDLSTAKRVARLDSSKSKCVCNRGIYKVVFSPDGKKLAIAFGAMLFLFETESGQLVHHFTDPQLPSFGPSQQSHRSRIQEILFSDDGKTIISGSYANAISWSLETGELLHRFPVDDRGVTALAISPDNQRLAVGTGREIFKVFDLRSGRLLYASEDLARYLRNLSFSPDGTKIFSETTNRARIHDSRTGQFQAEMQSHRNLGVRISKDWRYVLVRDKKGEGLSLYRYLGQ